MELEKAVTAAELSAEAPSEIQLMPAGEIRTRPHDGRTAWKNPDAAAVVAATRELQLDLPIDYEHQSERAAANGQPAPAAGWIKRVFARGGAIWGEVEWTERATAHIQSREYRYISPVFLFEKSSRIVKQIVGAALTNDPAFFMRAIASADHKEATVKIEELRKVLGLPDDATEEQVLAAAKAAATASAALTKVAVSAGLAEDANPAEIETAVAQAKAGAGGGDVDPSKYVPRAEYDQTAAALKAVQTERAEEKATAAVDTAVTAGKVSPAQREWALGYAKSDPEGFKAYADAAPVIVKAGARTMPSAEGGETRSFRAPDGRSVDEERLGLHQRATARAKKDGISYEEAAVLEEEGA